MLRMRSVVVISFSPPCYIFLDTVMLTCNNKLMQLFGVCGHIMLGLPCVTCTSNPHLFSHTLNSSTALANPLNKHIIKHPDTSCLISLSSTLVKSFLGQSPQLGYELSRVVAESVLLRWPELMSVKCQQDQNLGTRHVFQEDLIRINLKINLNVKWRFIYHGHWFDINILYLNIYQCSVLGADANAAMTNQQTAVNKTLTPLQPRDGTCNVQQFLPR